MSNEVTLDIDTQNVIDALEDTGDYKVFEDNTDGCEEAINWVLEMEMMDGTASGFILDRLRPDEVIPYAWDTYLNKTVNHLVSDRPILIDRCCDTIIQGIIDRKGVDYVLDQCGLDNRVTRAVTTDYHYIIDALVERRGLYIADSEEHAMTNLFWKMLHSVDQLSVLGVSMEDNCSDKEIDALLGPIYSDKIIRHLEESIDAMVIRKREDPTTEMIEILLSYFDEFDFRVELIKQMRRHGIMLETILRAYIEDERAEEREAHDI